MRTFIQTDKDAPCMDCQDRHQLCHADCERYAEYRKPFEQIYERRRANAISRQFIHDGVTKSLRSRHRRLHK